MTTALPRPRFLLLALTSAIGAFVACGGDDPSDVPTDAGPGAATDSSVPGVGTDAAPVEDAGALADADAAAPVVETIQGKVHYGYSFVPGAIVVIQGKSATTGADGSFRIAGVQIPYDLSLVVPPTLRDDTTSASYVQHYAGLTTVTPFVTAAVRLRRDVAVASMSGRLLGLAGGPNTRFLTRSFAPLAEGDMWTRVYPDEYSDDTYQNRLTWPLDQTTRSVGIVALEVVSSDVLAIPTAYKSMSRTTFVAAAGGTYPDKVPAAAPVATAHVSGTVQVPDGYRINNWQLSVGNAEGLRFDFRDSFPSAPPPTTFDFVIPDHPSLDAFSVGVIIAGGPHGPVYFWKPVAKGDTNIVLTPTPPPSQQLPADGASGVGYGTMLSWGDPQPDCIYEVNLSSEVPGATAFSLKTTATSITIPDLREHFAGLVESSRYSWNVNCLRRFGTANMNAEMRLEPAASAGFGNGRARPFTTP